MSVLLIIVPFLLLPVVLVSARWWRIRPSLFAAAVGFTYALGQAWLESITFAGINGSQLLIVSVTGLMVIRMSKYTFPRPGVVRLPSFALPLILLLFSALIALVLSPLKSLAVPSFLRMFIGLFVLLFGYYTGAHRGTVPVYQVMIEVVAVTVSLTSIYDLIIGSDQTLIFGEEVRARGSLGNPIQSGLLSLLGIPVFMYRLLAARTRGQRLIALAGFVMCGFGLFAAFTRRCLVAAVIFLGSYVVFNARHSTLSPRKVKLSLAIISLSLASGLYIVDTDTLAGRIDDIPFIGDIEATDQKVGSGRFSLWSDVWDSVTRSEPLEWIWGHGLHTSHNLMNKASHNTYMELLLGQGLVGLGSYLAFLYMLFVALRRIVRAGGTTALAADVWSRFLVGFAIGVDVFGSAIYQMDVRWYVYLMIGAILGTRYLQRSNPPPATQVRSPRPPGTASTLQPHAAH